MQVTFVLGLEFLLSKSDAMAPRELTRTGLQDDMTFIGSAATLNRSWNEIEGTLTDAGHRLRGYERGVRAPEFEQFDDLERPPEVRDLCMRVPRKRHGVSLFGSAANMHHCMHVGWDNLQSRLHRRLRVLRKPWRLCRALRDLLAINMTTSALRRRGCS